MTPQEITQAFEAWRTLHNRRAWLPVTSIAVEGTSWFGGPPSHSASGDWPVCVECKKPMQFFLQLDLATLPEGFNSIQRTGMVQLFYCGSDNGMCETWQPFTGTHNIRLFSEAHPIARPRGTSELARNTIVAWDEFADTPHPEEHERCGVSYDYDFVKNRVSVNCDSPPISFQDLDIDLNVAELVSSARTGDKLGGWPHWVQSAEYPSCPECRSQMELLIQIDSEDHLPYMFGDAGCAHLTQCRNHPQVLAFGWACS